MKEWRLLGLIGRMICRKQRADLAVAVLRWVPAGSTREVPIVGVGRTTTEAQTAAFCMARQLSLMPRPGLS